MNVVNKKALSTAPKINAKKNVEKVSLDIDSSIIKKIRQLSAVRK